MRYGQIRIIAGQWRSRKLRVPAKTRPPQNALRESLFAILQPHLDAARCLDLYAGSGSLGLEALSRGAKSVAFVEKSRIATKILNANIDELDAKSQTTVILQDVHNFVSRTAGQQFEIIFADPPYSDAIYDKWWANLLGATRKLIYDNGFFCCESPRVMSAPSGWSIKRATRRGTAHLTILSPNEL